MGCLKQPPLVLAADAANATAVSTAEQKNKDNPDATAIVIASTVVTAAKDTAAVSTAGEQ